MDNRSLIEKADAALADLTSGGKLSTEQARDFYEVAIENTKLLPLCTTKTFDSPEYEIPKIGMSDTFLVGGQESTALSEGDRTKPEFSKTTLSPKELVGEARIPYAMLEDSIAQGPEAFQRGLIALIGKAAGRDIERAVLRGDTSLAASSKLNRLLRSFDGVIKQATTNSVAAGGVRFGKANAEAAMRTVPAQFYDDSLGAMVHLTSKNASIDWSSAMANRATPVGDKTLVGAYSAGPPIGGTYVVGLNTMPENLGGGNNETISLFGNPKQIWVGFKREITMETTRDISARVWVVVITLRMDVKFEHEPAWVKTTGILASAS